MRLKVLKSKLHLATITKADLHYHGSLTIDPELMDAVGLHPYEAILVSNVSTGLRGETYVLPGTPGLGQIELNGAKLYPRKACSEISTPLDFRLSRDLTV